MVDQPLSPDDQDLAGELALGLLDGAERAAALRLVLSRPAFAAEVEAWNGRLTPLLDTIPGERPPERVWRTIEARLDDAPRSSATMRSLRLWRGGAVAAAAIAASLALFIVVRPGPLSSPPAALQSVAISQLADAQGASIMAISYDPRNGLLRLSSSGLESGTKSPELWVIPNDGVPRSLGIVGQSSGTLPVAASLRQFLKSGVILAITLEDAATAPHKAPSAAPILTGKISII